LTPLIVMASPAASSVVTEEWVIVWKRLSTLLDSPVGATVVATGTQ
jgi:hypothetical protein